MTSKKLALHLWYLSEELVALALFDSHVTHKTKTLMIAAMVPDKAVQAPQERSSKRPTADLNFVLVVSNYTASHCVCYFCVASVLLWDTVCACLALVSSGKGPG